MKKITKKRIQLLLNRIDTAALGGYTLLTGDAWMKVFAGTADIVAVATIAAWTMFIMVIWAVIDGAHSSHKV